MIIFKYWDSKFKSRNQRRLDRKNAARATKPCFSRRYYNFEVAFRNHATSFGGLAPIHQLVHKLGLPETINQHLHLLKVNRPYFESDHVLGITYNAFCQGTCLDDLDRLRHDEAFLDMLGTQRLPDPTTAGDFCRRFQESDINDLQKAFDVARTKVWQQQPSEFFEQATIDVDGTFVETGACCKQGIDISYKGIWGYHPLVVSLAETGEVLRIVNRPANRPSHEDAFMPLNESIEQCIKAGFRKVRLRGDTDFSQTKYLDIWNRLGMVNFVFGFDSIPNLREKAEKLPAAAWKKLERPAKYVLKTVPRTKPERVKDRLVKDHGFNVLRLRSEEVAEFNYQPTACSEPYRMVVVRKNISKEKGELVLFDEIRYFFYITNDRKMTTAEIVFDANDRCNQENLHAELKGSVGALRAPTNTLESNWAWMVMASLAWSLKAWWALSLPETGRHRERHQAQKTKVLRMEFRTFVNTFVMIPCQIAKKARGIVVTILSWNPERSILFRLLQVLRQ